jgi:hypothetical protein
MRRAALFALGLPGALACGREIEIAGGSADGGARDAIETGDVREAEARDAAEDVVVVEDASDAPVGNPCAPATLVATAGSPTSVALDATYVYWVTTPASSAPGSVFGAGGAVESARRTGGGGSLALVKGVTGAMSLATSDGFLAYASVGPDDLSGTGTVGLTTTPSGAGSTVLATALLDPGGVAIDDMNVYWVSEMPAGGENTYDLLVQSAPLSGGTASVIAVVPGYVGAGIAVQSGALYFAGQTSLGDGGSAIFVLPTIGGTANSLQEFSTGSPYEVTTDSSRVYWNDVLRGALYSMPLGGGAVSTVARGLKLPKQLAVDSNNVYVADGIANGAIYEVPAGGESAKRVLFTAGDGGIPYGVAADDNDDFVYFSLYVGNAICKVAK